MNQILGIDLQNANPKESLTGCNSSETLSDDSYVPLGFETNESMVGAKTDWLSDDRQPNAAILGIPKPDSEDLSAIGQEADNSPEIDRFVTDLLPETEVPDTSLNPTLFPL
jgi:hypothetical protein